MDADFGRNVSVEDILVDTLKEKITSNSIETQLMLLESYDIHQNIFRHGEVANRPFALVELHEKERLQRVNPLYELFRTYVENEVLKYTGIPYNTFIEMPRDVTRQIMEDCKKYRERDYRTSQTVLQELEDIKNIGKK